MSPTESFFLCVDKPIGMTSQQCLTQLKRRFGWRKIGHHGTLDPFASGLLLVGVNEATKFFPYVDDERKVYEGIMRFGIATDTLDHTGKIVQTTQVPTLTVDDIKKILNELTGCIEQTPPMYSAIKQDGVPLYELARAGQSVERKPRSITVESWKILEWNSPDLKFEVTVSRGTYVRVLAEQVAQKLNTCAHLTHLRRTQLSGVEIQSAFAMDSAQENVVEKISIPSLLRCQNQLELSEEQCRELYLGRVLELPEDDQDCIALNCQGQFFGVGILKKRQLITLRLFAPESIPMRLLGQSK